MRSLLVVLLSLSLALAGCAPRSAVRLVDAGPGAGVPVAIVSEALSKLPVGTAVAINLADGRRVRGTLMHADAASVVVYPRGRVPEPPVTIPVADVRAFEIDRPSSMAKVIAIGAAAGAAAALGVIFLIVAMIDD